LAAAVALPRGRVASVDGRDSQTRFLLQTRLLFPPPERADRAVTPPAPPLLAGRRRRRHPPPRVSLPNRDVTSGRKAPAPHGKVAAPVVPSCSASSVPRLRAPSADAYAARRRRGGCGQAAVGAWCSLPLPHPLAGQQELGSARLLRALPRRTPSSSAQVEEALKFHFESRMQRSEESQR